MRATVAAMAFVSSLRCSRMAMGSLLACAPMFVARRPGTPLRVLCVAAFEYLARLHGGTLDSRVRAALAHACDLGALRNDYYDQQKFDRTFYRELRRKLRGSAPHSATLHYIRELRQAERGRPRFGPDGFSEPRAVVAYRNRVLDLSLDWLRAISHRAPEPRLFRSVVALVRLIQLVDDLLDWRDDWACRRPTYVTAFFREWAGSSRLVMTQVCRHANRFRRSLRSASDRHVEALPLRIAGGAVWLMAIVLTRIRFSE